jgi:hypothetical protein
MDKKKKVTQASNVSKEKAEDIKKANESDKKEFLDPWEQLLFGRRREAQPQETQDKERPKMVEGNEDSEKNDGKGKGFSWI